MKIELKQTSNKGHWEVGFADGLQGIAVYDKTLADVIALLNTMQPQRVVNSIAWIED